MRGLPFLNSNEYYRLLLVGRETASESLIEVTPDREIEERNRKTDINLNQSGSGGLGFGGRLVNIVGLHPSVAYSVSLALEVERDESHGPHLSGPEVENLLTKEVSQRYIQLRDEAATALGIDQVDTILADSRVKNFRINGRRVIHPVGCTAKTFEATTELTFTSRNLYEAIKKYINRKNFFLSDAGRSVLQGIARDAEPPFGLLALDYPQSTYLRLEKATAKTPALKRGVIPWSTNSLTDAIMTSWEIDREAAESIWKSFCEDELPEEVHKFLETKCKKALQPLEKVLKKIPSRGENFLTTNRPVPQSLLSIDKMSPAIPHLIERLEKMGFAFKEQENPNYLSSLFFLGLLEDYFSDRGHTDINRWLRRRLHWLGSVEYN